MKRIADLCYLLLVLVGHFAALLAWLWHCWRAGVAPGTRAYRAALLWDLLLATLLGADEGETVSTWMARLRPSRVPCAFCRLLAVRWPSHCDQAAGVRFKLTKE